MPTIGATAAGSPSSATASTASRRCWSSLFLSTSASPSKSFAALSPATSDFRENSPTALLPSIALRGELSLAHELGCRRVEYGRGTLVVAAGDGRGCTRSERGTHRRRRRRLGRVSRPGSA